ncbi:unnamed protein product [Microthlaspi erraticum]|uniref:Retrotransposon gag domain-containing protein n=1 Tax=Microthlaspi erraticum TaxID=1685480 RepID=A0A6D2HXB9_9BRAS|nr:unnamed protein product [Microthlaspi erraticum]
MTMPSTRAMELEPELEPDGAKHVELEPDGIKDIKLEVEEKLYVMDKLVANQELAAEKKPLAAPMQLELILSQDGEDMILNLPGTMVSEKEDEEESRKSLSETLLEQLKKMMIEEFDRREQNKEGKWKQPKDPVTSMKKETAEQGSQCQSRRSRYELDRKFEDLSGYMMMIPPFNGNNDPDVYLDWEKKCEITFNRHNIADINRVKLAAMEFKYYALSWWKQVETARAYSGAYEIST